MMNYKMGKVSGRINDRSKSPDSCSGTTFYDANYFIS